MADPNAALQARIAAIRELGQLPRIMAPKAAKEIKRELSASIARGESPDGSKLKLTAKGMVPLRNAAKAIEVSARGTIILTRIDGPEARHHIGAVKGGKDGSLVRRLIPTGGVPDLVINALDTVAIEEANRIMGQS